MNEKNKGAFLLIIGAVIVLGVLAIMYFNDKQQQEIVNNYNKLYDNSEATLVYFGKDGCNYCTTFTPVLEEVLGKFNLKYNYINSGKVNNTRLLSMLEKGGVDVEEFGTPTIVVIKDGKAVANNIGAMDREKTFAFLQKNGFIPADAVLPAEFEHLTMIDYNKYNELINSDSEQVIVIGQTSCTYCTKAKPYYDQIAKEKNIDIYYLDYTKLTTDEKTNFDKSLSYFVENASWGTPLMLIVKNKTVIGVDSGFANKALVENFLLKYNIIK